MRISKRTRYGVRFMLELALHYQKKPLSVGQIAELEGISAKFLGQIIIPLKNAGLIESTRGAQGGYELASPPGTMTVLDVFRVLEGDCLLTECIEDATECTRSGGCVARDIWKEVSAAMEQRLQGLNFGELADRARAFKERQSPVYQI